MMQKKQNIQIMRGLAILMVLFQHALVAVFGVGGYSVIISVCFNIDVNVFMFISGYLFESNLNRYLIKGGWEFVKSKASCLFVPYVFWECLLYIPVWIVYNGPACLSRLEEKLYALGFFELSIREILISLITFNNSYIELYWFIYVLFIIFILECFIGKTLMGRNAVLLIILLPILLYLSNMAYIVKKLCIAIIIFKVGREIRRREFPIDQMKPWALVIAIVVFGIVFKAPDVKGVPLVEQLYYIVKSAILGLCGVVIVAVIANCLGSSQNKVSALVEKIGDYSFSIYIMHNPYVIKAVSLLLPNKGLYGLFSLVACMILGVLIPCAADRYIISKVSALSRIMLGKKVKVNV